MKINQEQFDNELRKMQDVRLDEDAKLRIKSSLDTHIATYTPKKITSPYSHYFHYSYKMAFVSLVLVLSISLGTAYASQSSLPGDMLYQVKTDITEPIIKLTKKTKKDKESFDLYLADKRIQEVEELIKEDKITEARLERNLFLFEKHLNEREKDREIETKTESNSIMLMETDKISNINSEKDESDKRVDRYRELMNSKPNLNNFYENKAKAKLEKRIKKLDSLNNQTKQEEKSEIQDLVVSEEKENTEDENDLQAKEDIKDIETEEDIQIER
ncbi:MAG: hypothetical protein NTW98_02585 [Candidatus Nomurabacteria bacterium]|nr:hypothetical protein [Candidatus Nomurabacteria bacterium]